MKKLIPALALAALSLVAPARADNYDAMAGVMAVSVFVTKHCPELRTNSDLIAGMFEVLKVDMQIMRREPYQSTILRLATGMASSTAYSCEVASTLFGSEGTQIKNLVLPK